jgi:hypothetical protein
VPGLRKGYPGTCSSPQTPRHDSFYLEPRRPVRNTCPHSLILSCSCVHSSHTAAWVAKARDVIEVHEAGTPQFRLGVSTPYANPRWTFPNESSPGLWRRFFDTPSYQKHFEAAEETKWKYILPVTTEGVVTRALSKSYISVLSDEERGKVVDGLRNILETEQKSWVNEEEGVFEYPYETTVVVVNRK